MSNAYGQESNNPKQMSLGEYSPPVEGVRRVNKRVNVPVEGAPHEERKPSKGKYLLGAFLLFIVILLLLVFLIPDDNDGKLIFIGGFTIFYIIIVYFGNKYEIDAKPNDGIDVHAHGSVSYGSKTIQFIFNFLELIGHVVMVILEGFGGALKALT